MILSVYFFNLNQQDDLNIVVDKFSTKIVYQASKVLNDNETIWVKIFSDGLANFGLTLKCDPWHNDQPYTWSSRAEVINEELGLKDTPFELARHNIGASEGPGQCRFDRGILASIALKLAEANQKNTHYGLVQFWKDNYRKIVFAKPEPGLTTTEEIHVIWNPEINFYEKYIVCTDKRWISVNDLSDYIFKRDGIWSLRDWYNRTI